MGSGHHRSRKPFAAAACRQLGSSQGGARTACRGIERLSHRCRADLLKIRSRGRWADERLPGKLPLAEICAPGRRIRRTRFAEWSALARLRYREGALLVDVSHWIEGTHPRTQ